MSYFPRSDLLAAFSGAGRQDTVLVPGVVVFANRPRPIFLANTDRKRQEAMLAFFANSRRRMWAGALALRLGRRAIGSITAAELRLPELWRDSFRCGLSPVALYCGSPGPLQKVTLLVPADEGQAGVVIKVSLRPTADDVVSNEARIITEFVGMSERLTAHLPELVGYGGLASGRRYLATGVGPGRVGDAALSPSYARFLAELGRATRVDQPWCTGPAMTTTRSALALARGRTMTDEVHDRLARALDRVDRQLQATAVPHVLVHGDFTRFNIRQSGERFSVFDWEYARRGANPIADALHFHISQPGSQSMLTVMHHGLAVIEHLMQQAYEGWVPSPRDLSALALHCLVDTMTFYSNAGTPLDFESFLVRRYLGLIAAHDQWGLE